MHNVGDNSPIAPIMARSPTQVRATREIFETILRLQLSHNVMLSGAEAHSHLAVGQVKIVNKGTQGTYLQHILVRCHVLCVMLSLSKHFHRKAKID